MPKGGYLFVHNKTHSKNSLSMLFGWCLWWDTLHWRSVFFSTSKCVCEPSDAWLLLWDDVGEKLIVAYVEYVTVSVSMSHFMFMLLQPCCFLSHTHTLSHIYTFFLLQSLGNHKRNMTNAQFSVREFSCLCLWIRMYVCVCKGCINTLSFHLCPFGALCLANMLSFLKESLCWNYYYKAQWG